MVPKAAKLQVGDLSGTDLVHADDSRAGSEVAPSISVSTSESNPFKSNNLIPISLLASRIAFKYPDPSTNPAPFSEWDPLKPETKHIYSRYTQNVSSRAEQVLSRINVRSAFKMTCLISPPIMYRMDTL